MVFYTTDVSAQLKRVSFTEEETGAVSWFACTLTGPSMSVHRKQPIVIIA
jgi:hypothetical protein